MLTNCPLREVSRCEEGSHSGKPRAVAEGLGRQTSLYAAFCVKLRLGRMAESWLGTRERAFGDSGVESQCGRELAEFLARGVG
jgi:hypothetical protein